MKQRFFTNCFLFCLCMFFSLETVKADGTTLYVDASKASNGVGTSWATAYKSLGDALAFAHANTTYKTIKVAAGTYKPTKKPFNSGTEMTTTDGRDLTFHIPDGVTIEGGYNASTGARDITANVTILSGVIGTTGEVPIKAYHVVLASAASSGGVGVTIDGFSITGGNANANADAASIFTVNGNSTFRNGGGGIFTTSGTNTLINNTLYSNFASYGGGIETLYSTNTLSNNTLYSNSAAFGGGIYTSSSTNTLSNNTLYSNSATSGGGGIYTSEGTNTLSNNTLYSNSASTYGGGIYTYFGTNTLTNNIFWQNKTGTDATVASADYFRVNSTNTLKNNLLQLASSSYTFGNSNALGTGASGNIHDQDPLFVSITAGAIDLRLQATSPCINAGITGVGIPTTDITGATRTGNPDLGAYEYLSSCPSGTTLHVNAAVSGGTGDGSSFANAYASLANALAKAHACSNIKTIKVAAGTYLPTKKPFNSGTEMTTTDSRDLTFHIPDGVTIEGGYNASTGARDITANVTILSGDIGTASVATDNAYNVVIASAASSGGVGVTIDGFSITGGNGDVTTAITVNANLIIRSYGGGIYTIFGTNTLSNNTLYSNSAFNLGGGIYTGFGTNTLSNNTLYSNSTSNNGGGIGTQNGTNTLSNNTLYSNSANSNGGGIYTINGTNTLTNNIFWANKQGTNATVAYADYTASGTNGNTFKNNLLQLASSNYTTTGSGFYDLGTGASGNVFAQDPLFVSTTPGAIDLRLQATSPCINAGITGVGIPTTDITGATRTGNPDLGAYEYVAPTCTTPTAYSVTGTGSYCSGGTGVAVGLANSETGVTYQLKNGATNVGSAVNGTTGSAVTFGNQTTVATYSVVATRTVGGCTANMTGSAVVTVQPALGVTATSTSPSVVGGSNGTATAVGTGGNGSTYAYTWNAGGATTAATNTGLAAGTYTVSVTSGACTVAASTTVVVSNPIVAVTAASASSTPPSCNGGSNGSITVVGQGGIAPYTYASSAASGLLTGLTAGTYTVTITSANMSSGTTAVTVSQPNLFSAAATVQSGISCNGGSNGVVKATASSGIAPYAYTWSNGVNTAINPGRPAGTYAVTVSDANACTATSAVAINDPTLLTATATQQTGVSCIGSNGVAKVTAAGGTAPYTYLWANGAATATNSSLSAGTYFVTVTDANGCLTTSSAVITNNTLIATATIQTGLSCNGGSTGVANATATGGTAPYTYEWSIAVATATISNLSAGDYAVTVTDQNGCTASSGFTMTNNTLTAMATVQIGISCNGGTNGVVNVTASGGITPYTYLWANGATSATNPNRPAGFYNVTVTDANACTATSAVAINAPTLITATATQQTGVSCGGSNGVVKVTASGGTPITTVITVGNQEAPPPIPYTYLWSQGATTATVSGLSAGTYAVTVTDANGCIATSSLIVTVNNASLAVAASATTPTLNCTTTSTVVAATPAGATTYAWTGAGLSATNIAAPTATPTVTTTYTVTVTAANGCSGTSSVTVINNSLTATCVSPTNPAFTVQPTKVDLSWTAGCFTNYRLQYRKANLSNAAWTLRLISGSLNSTSVPRTSLSNGTYAWGLKGACLSSNIWSPVAMGSNFTLSPPPPAALMSGNTGNSVSAYAYPNPTRDHLFVQLEGIQDKACIVRLTDQLGRTVYGQHHELDGINNVNIPTSALKDGIYLLSVIADGQVQTQRIVVTH